MPWVPAHDSSRRPSLQSRRPRPARRHKDMQQPTHRADRVQRHATSLNRDQSLAKLGALRQPALSSAFRYEAPGAARR